jgi:uncharacterized membrane protein
MEGLFILLAIAIFFSPFVLSVVALVQSSRLRREVKELRAMLSASEPAAPRAPSTEPRPEPAVPPVASAPPSPERIQPPPMPASRPGPESSIPPPAPRPKPSAEQGAGLEFAIGGKIASFVGIAAVVVAVVFFVGYAIQHGWIGPGTRIVLGLLAGTVLIGLGHAAEWSHRNLKVLARALTGGGAALFYFSVFAAYRMYHLIGGSVAAAGLIASAIGVLALAAAYKSQAVAVLGILGAYIAPGLLGGDFDDGLFPLAYVALVNLPVIFLGRRNNWQVLLGLASIATALIGLVWLAEDLMHDSAREWRMGLGFAVFFYAEFAVLGFLRIGMERTDASRAFDILRLLFAATALLGAIEWVLRATGHKDWLGAAYLSAAAVHVVVLAAARRRAGAFKEEVLAFTVIALTFASLALPAQLDGAWVSLGWSIEGAILAWFALRVRSPLLQAGAFALGLLGLGKSVLFDVTLFDASPTLFLNSRFAVGLLSSLLLGVQGRLQGNAEPAVPGPRQDRWSPLLYCAAMIAVLVVVFGDAFPSLGHNDPWAWAITTMAMLIVGMVASAAASLGREVAALGLAILVAVPIKLLVFDLAAGWHVYRDGYRLFGNALFLLHILPVGLVAYWVSRLQPRRNAVVAVNVLSIAAALAVVTLELGRVKGDWADSLISIFWAGSALALVFAGLVRRRAYLRYCGLLLFVVTVVKVFLVDMAEISGLQRIAAFFGVGVLMLIVSYAYQRVAHRLLQQSEEK